MKLCRNNMIFYGLLLVVSLVCGQEYYEDLHNSRYAMHFKEIPKRFELKGSSANKEFKKYFDEIQAIAKKENVTVVYKVKLEILKPIKSFGRMVMLKKVKSKKYNVPLKKNSMKLSNFEVMMRKMAEQTGHNQNYESYMNYPVTTESEKKIMSTKIIQLKYKPIISRIRTNYTKRIRPVKNRIITLTV